MSNYRYTVISFNFDNYEVVREIKNPLPDVEYVYVTNDRDVTSDTWNIVVDPYYDTIDNSFDKVVEFRHRVLSYCHTDVCCRIDGSIAISGDAFDKTIDEFNKRGDDIAFIMHPWFNRVSGEYKSWATLRGIPHEEVDKIMNFFYENGYNPNINTVYTLGVIIQRNNEVCRNVNEKQYEVLCQLREYCGSEHFNRCDQAVFTYTMDKYFNHLKVLPLHYTILERLDVCSIYKHKSDKLLVVNKIASYEVFYRLFGNEINTVFNGEKWVSLLTDSEIYQRAVKILLKTTDKVYEKKFKDTELGPIKESYRDWYTNEDVITIGSSNIEDYQYMDPNNRHHYTMDWYYKKLLPLLVNELEIPYNEDDFTDVKKGNIYCKMPKEEQEFDVYCPYLVRKEDCIEVFYDIESLHSETSTSMFMANSVYQPEIFPTVPDAYHKIFKYCHFPVKIVNYTCKNNDAILIVGNSHTIPFISILTKYYHTVVVIDNRVQCFTYDFMFAYIDFKKILLMGSYEKYKGDLLKVTRFD